MEYETILYELESGVLTITFNRPERLNAFSPEMNQEFRDAIARADADDDVRAVIVTGAGRAFSDGADLSRGGDTSRSRMPSEYNQRIVLWSSEASRSSSSAGEDAMTKSAAFWMRRLSSPRGKAKKSQLGRRDMVTAD